MNLSHIGFVHNEHDNFSIEIYYDRYDYIVFVYKNGKDFKSFRAIDMNEIINKLNEFFTVFRIVEKNKLLD